MKFATNSLILFFLLTLYCTGIGEKSEIVIREASGITRLQDAVLIVGDDADGQYFELTINDENAHIIPVDPLKVRSIPMPGASLASDLEAIDVLADGRICVLSEDLNCLLARQGKGAKPYGIIAEYDKSLSEFAGRGLEGLAVKSLPGENSRVAVLWEGGYPEQASLPSELRNRIGRFPLNPVIVVHDVERNGTAGMITQPLNRILLEVPKPEGEIPDAQRFRGADLVWHEWKDDKRPEQRIQGFIVLLSSDNSPLESSDVRKYYRYKILLRFDMEGIPYGEPLEINPIGSEWLHANCEQLGNGRMDQHLKTVCRLLDEEEWENVNWEGLGWFIKGQKLITVYDKNPMDPPFALVIDIPEHWR